MMSASLEGSSTVETLMSINQSEMARLYTEGIKDGVTGPLWRFAPPEVCPGEGDYVRGGLRLQSTDGGK